MARGSREGTPRECTGRCIADRDEFAHVLNAWAEAGFIEKHRKGYYIPKPEVSTMGQISRHIWGRRCVWSAHELPKDAEGNPLVHPPVDEPGFRKGIRLDESVLSSFLKRPKPPNSKVVHLDGDIANCALWNLYWAPV